MFWNYEKLDENYNMVSAPQNDIDGNVTGHIVLNLKAWFDEHPAEARRLGWTKHIHHESDEIAELCPHNAQTQYIVVSTRQVDDFTVEDTYRAMDKSEEMMLLEEMLEIVSDGIFSSQDSGFVFTMN